MSQSFTYGDSELSPNRYGSSYEREFRRVLEQYVKNRTLCALEWGAGNTTILLKDFYESIAHREKWICSIDHNEPYLQALKEKLTGCEFLDLFCVDVTGPCRSQIDKGLNYSTFPLKFRKEFDFIFIDGRRRMECAFMAMMMAHDETVVCVHDYRRARYQGVLSCFQILEDGPQFRVMKVRSGMLPMIQEMRPFVFSQMLEHDEKG